MGKTLILQIKFHYAQKTQKSVAASRNQDKDNSNRAKPDPDASNRGGKPGAFRRGAASRSLPRRESFDTEPTMRADLKGRSPTLNTHSARRPFINHNAAHSRAPK
ncbi:hypothetical protein GWI33_005695 [Rhynchophorus ferrugineus]|uniref:Uncharacterized protein n=1 Tax=Rhynchophorus ferrugineus TaxID=354439 RepID=A0A834IH04_RHYFE|nr:hypothetical protein GWI33_005695 [Rhynchophorus ferrugineus]